MSHTHVTCVWNEGIMLLREIEPHPHLRSESSGVKYEMMQYEMQYEMYAYKAIYIYMTPSHKRPAQRRDFRVMMTRIRPHLHCAGWAGPGPGPGHSLGREGAGGTGRPAPAPARPAVARGHGPATAEPSVRSCGGGSGGKKAGRALYRLSLQRQPKAPRPGGPGPAACGLRRQARWGSGFGLRM